MPCTKREDSSPLFSVHNNTFLLGAGAQISWQNKQMVNLETLPTVTEVDNLKTNRYSFYCPLSRNRGILPVLAVVKFQV